MKHIKRKFLEVKKIPDDGYKFLVDQMPNAIKPSIKDLETKIPFIVSTEKDFIQSFFYDLEAKKVIIPEPNPIVIYFSNAQGFLADTDRLRNDLFKGLKSNKPSIGDMLNNMFGFYSCVSNITSSLCNSLEAFVNSKIPKDYKYQDRKDLRRKPINKYQILRTLSFEKKVELVFADLYDQSFSVNEPQKFQILLNLKDLRNDVTHAKADIDYEVNYYEKIYTKALDFNFLEALECSRDFINFYEPNLIEPCNCGKTH